MAILTGGTLVDRSTISRAGDAGTTSQRVELTTRAHSLPATNPEFQIVNLRSVEGVAGYSQTPKPFALGGNASLATTGFEYASGVSAGTIMFDLVNVVVHSIVR